eukprot:3989233-Amphidinium_carterae.1
MEVATVMSSQTMIDEGHYDVMRKMIVSTLLIGITTLAIAVYTSWKLCQQRSKPPTQDKGTQTSSPHDSERAQDASDDIFVYPQGRRFHTRWNCRAVTGARSQPRQYSRCQICG